MTAPDLKTLLSFSSQLDAAFVAAIDPSVSLSVFPYFTDADLPDERIDLRVTVQQATGPQGTTQLFDYYPGKIAPSAYNAEAQIAAITHRKNSISATIEGEIQAAILLKAGELNDKLDYLQVLTMDYQRTSRGKTEGDLDLTEIVYNFKFCIKPSAWPLTEDTVVYNGEPVLINGLRIFLN